MGGSASSKKPPETPTPKGVRRNKARSAADEREVATKALCKSAIHNAGSRKDCEDQVIEAFQKWDVDGSGSITRAELAAIFQDLSADLPANSIDVLLQEADANNDQCISYEEMVGWLFAAPHLEKYFKVSEVIHRENLKEAAHVADECKNIVTRSNSPAEAERRMEPVKEKFQRKCQARIHNELTPLIKKAFAWHDKDDDGVLDHDESIIFFGNYANMLGEYLLRVFTLGNGQQTPSTQVQRLYKNKLQQLIEVYVENTDEHHRAAIRVLDVNGDGKLQESEVLDGLLHGHAKNSELLAALGFMVPMEEILVAISASG